MTLPAEFEWTLTVLSVAQGSRAGERRYRLRVRTNQSDKAIDINPADVPARLAELCTQLGLEGVTMDHDFDLTKLAGIKREHLDDLDREMRELTAKRQRLAREVKAIEKCAAMLDGEAPKRASGKHKRDADAGPTVPEQILGALAAGAVSLDRLAEQLDRPRGVIARAVGQLAKRGAVVRVGDTITAKARRKAA